MPLTQIAFWLSPELLAAIDAANDGKVSRNAYLEQRLRRDPQVKKAASEAGIDFPPPRKRGRPWPEDSEKDSHA